MVSKFGTRARSQEDRRAQLRRAAAKRASLRHPHVLPARLVEGEEGRARLVLQPCTSPTLRAVLKRGPLSTKNGVALIVGLASAVEALAREGLVARELNPDAVLLHRSRGAILADYAMPPALVGQPTARRDANAAYRSPEEREGRELTPRSSVYSLGAILVSALTAAQAPEQLLPQQARRTRDVPPTIESVIAQAMAADPTRRFADVTEMTRAAVDVVRASDRIGRMEAPAPQKQKPSRAVSWRSAQHPATALLRAVAPPVNGNGARLAAAPADAPEETAPAEAAQRKAAQDAQRRERAEQAAERKREQAAERKREQAAAKRARHEAAKRAREDVAQRKHEQAAAKRERDEAAAKRNRDEAAKRKREQAAAKRRRDDAAKRKRDDAAKRKREEAAKRKSVAAAKRNPAPATRRRGPTESGRKRTPRRGATVESSAGPAAKGAANAATIGSPRNILARHQLPLLGLAIVAGAAGVSALALTGGSSEAKTVRISEAGLSMRVPAGWERVARPAPRLDWLSGTLGAASSDGTGRGLVTGVIREPDAAQRALRELLPAGASGKTVRLGRFEAERYSDLNFGSGLIGTAYVVHTTGPSIAMICRGGEAAVRQCTGAAATVTLRGERPVPTAVAGRRERLVREAVRTLSAERVAGRREVATALVADDQAKAARGLQASYLQAAGRVDLSGAYGARIEALSAALREASDRYGDLAESINAGDQRAYDDARAAVVDAETQVWGESVAN
jgi:Protein tyrosine and serine/threonine kinase